MITIILRQLQPVHEGLRVWQFFSDKRKQAKVDQGRFNVTGDKIDRYVFRVPSLRLAALASPYFYDASIKMLKRDITCIVKLLKTLPGEYKGQPLCKEHKPHETNKKP